MKKIFTLIAIAMMAVGAKAQTISFTADDVASAGTLNGKTFGEDFKLTIVDTTDDGKVAIDKNSAYFGTADEQVKFEYRLKTGGKSSSKNCMTLTAPAAGTVKVYARTASSGSERAITFTQDGTELLSQKLLDANATTVSISDKDTSVHPVYSMTVAKGDIAITYADGAINFYAFEFTATGTGINNVKAAQESEVTYNVAGQKVGAGYKGLIIKNGKKMVVK